ncbi:MAG: methyltransferase domain-containing protein [Pseudomonadales bacterium]|nr:methyltransferase domain-containing protein [Pseudomonadales bacterium]MDP6470588.1 methyltransferase domain-containing protein [Pseudomonadales bacterium]MDP6828557.1 methyltransferase domain-containing protein [Pseudomonadales bacterium]MDP6972043.1 methyltransferase domain-containing protein [Pseudomonadales bacterium]
MLHDMTKRMTRGTLLVFISVLTTACGTQQDQIGPALDAPGRSQADLERDSRSKPHEVLIFFGATRGMVVLDLFAGSGYYSEILGNVVGDSGKVYMHNNQAYLGFAGKALEERLGSGRVRNVVRYDREIDAIDLPEDSVDMVLMIMTYHDLYYETDGWSIDPEAFFAMLHRVLKPGGTLAIVDHVAVAGTGSSAAQDLHRIDPEFARQDIESRGFRLAGTSDALNNSDDALDVVVFDPKVQGKTSKFVYRFTSP